MGTILLVGEDVNLLESRAALLRTLPATVLSTSEAEFSEALGSQRTDVLVLCHSVSPARRAILSTKARHRWPGLRIIQILKTEYHLESVMDYPDRIVVAGDPAALVAEAVEQLSRGRQVNTPTAFRPNTVIRHQ